MRILTFSVFFVALALNSLAQDNTDSLYPEIRNFYPVDSFYVEDAKVFRGSNPVPQPEVLSRHKIDRVLIFRTMTKENLDNELQVLAGIGIRDSAVKMIPFPWKNISDPVAECENVRQGLNWVRAQAAQNSRVYVHCTAGEDRTGLIMALYRLWTEKRTGADYYRIEMCRKNYADANLEKPFDVAWLIHESLTPLYFAMAAQIETLRETHPRELPAQICANLQINPEHRYTKWCRRH